MSRLDRALGLGRSLLTYHAIPFRQRQLRRLYRGFVRPGDLVFDIGAHAGNRVRAFASLGCQVVAVEPQPDFARLLEFLFGWSAAVRIVPAAVSDHEGQVTLAVSERTPTVSTVARGWQAARAADADFSAVRWNRSIVVRATTLDALIAAYGRPSFIKIDVEGAEADVLAGLTHAIPVISFEYLLHAVDAVSASVDQLRRLGTYRFNWCPGESCRMASAEWLDAPHLLRELRRTGGPGHGDVYASAVPRAQCE